MGAGKCPARLVFFRQQNTRGGAICFGDDPNPDTVRKRVSGEEPETGGDGALVLLPVLVVEFAPITCNVPPEKCAGRLACHEQCIQCARRGHHVAERETGNHTAAARKAASWPSPGRPGSAPVP